MIARIKAWYYNVPFQIKEFWPAYWLHFAEKDDRKAGCYVIYKSISANHGDVVDLLLDDSRMIVHRYKVTEKGRASGSDHVVSPIQYNLQYVGTIPAEKAQSNYASDLYEPQLIVNT